MFAAILLPDDIRDELERIVEPRRDDQWRWSATETWHITLAFYAAVDPWRYEPLLDKLAGAASRTSPFPAGLAGVGTFPPADPGRAKLLYAAVDDPVGALAPLHRRCHNAAATTGIPVAAETYTPHLTLARSSRPIVALRWLRALAGVETQRWQVEEFALVQSHLGAGPPRYEVRERFGLGARS